MYINDRLFLLSPAEGFARGAGSVPQVAEARTMAPRFCLFLALRAGTQARKKDPGKRERVTVNVMNAEPIERSDPFPLRRPPSAFILVERLQSLCYSLS